MFSISVINLKKVLPVFKKIIPWKSMSFYNIGKRLSLQNLLTGTCFDKCFLNRSNQVISSYCSPPTIPFEATTWCEESMSAWKWYHCRRGNGIQRGPVWTVALIRTAKACKGNSPLPASWCLVSKEETSSTAQPQAEGTAGSSWSRKGEPNAKLLCRTWKGRAEGFFLTCTKKGSPLLSYTRRSYVAAQTPQMHGQMQLLHQQFINPNISKIALKLIKSLILWPAGVHMICEVSRFGSDGGRTLL